MKRAFQICIGITIILFVTAICIYNILPARIPTHWGASGQADGFGGKFMIFLMPVISLVLTFGLYYLPRIDPKRGNIEASGMAYPAVMISAVTIMAVIFAITVLESFGTRVPVNIIMPIALGAMFVVIGGFMPQIRPNYFFGIRLPWTLANETVWEKTHKFGGCIFFAFGLLFIVCVILPPPFNFAVPIAGLAVGIMVIAVYSYMEFRKIGS
ncbi:MAG: Immunity protein SdpI [Firmicutes bacterium ADurb.Bin193]|nr:MAG: Immunity protein SdpI [Firmicutes bacterium ADurb.Bin193]